MGQSKKKISMRRSVKVRIYPLVSNAVEAGTLYGWNRVWKHVDKPDAMPADNIVVETIVDAIMNELSELFDFDTEET